MLWRIVYVLACTPWSAKSCLRAHFLFSGTPCVWALRITVGGGGCVDAAELLLLGPFYTLSCLSTGKDPFFPPGALL